jgi:hypothetical protein
MFEVYFKVQTQRYYDLVLSNTIELLKAKNRNQEDNIAKYSCKEAELMKAIRDSPVSNLVQDLIISEFKEQIYEVMRFPYMTELDTDLAYEMERLILEYYGENSLYEHFFNPAHFIYNDGKHHYLFYHMVEVNGDSILDEWYDDY